MVVISSYLSGVFEHTMQKKTPESQLFFCFGIFYRNSIEVGTNKNISRNVLWITVP